MSVNQDIVRMLHANPGWLREMGITVLAAGPDEVTAEWKVEQKHLQDYGIVHGGVHCGVVESLASIGAAMEALPRGQRVVGLENSTSFLRAVGAGTLRGRATPVTRGRTTQVWEASIRDEEGRLVAQGRVRLLCVDGDRPLG